MLGVVNASHVLFMPRTSASHASLARILYTLVAEHSHDLSVITFKIHYCCFSCLLFGTMLKTPHIKLLQAINTHYLDTCVIMLYTTINKGKGSRFCAFQ